MIVLLVSGVALWRPYFAPSFGIAPSGSAR